jgi:hypothetical protein
MIHPVSAVFLAIVIALLKFASLASSFDKTLSVNAPQPSAQ